MHLFFNYHSFYIKQDLKILYNYCLSQLSQYRILSKKFGQITVNGPNQVKNYFFFFFSSAHLLVSAMRKLVTSFLERTGAMLFIDVTTEKKTFPTKRKRHESLRFFGWSIFWFWHTHSMLIHTSF